MTNAQRIAVHEFLDKWAGIPGQYLLEDIGPTLNCEEANALAQLLQEFGHADNAQLLIESHSREDDDGDDPAHVAIRNRLNNAETERQNDTANTTQPTVPATDANGNPTIR